MVDEEWVVLPPDQKTTIETHQIFDNYPTKTDTPFAPRTILAIEKKTLVPFQPKENSTTPPNTPVAKKIQPTRVVSPLHLNRYVNYTEGLEKQKEGSANIQNIARGLMNVAIEEENRKSQLSLLRPLPKLPSRKNRVKLLSTRRKGKKVLRLPFDYFTRFDRP